MCRWSLIAGRLPGRTPNDVKNYWNTYVGKNKEINIVKPNETVVLKPHSVIKPQPRTLSKNHSPCLKKWFHSEDQGGATQLPTHQACTPLSGCNNSNSNNNHSKDKWWGATTIEDDGNNPENQDWKHHLMMNDLDFDKELSDFLKEDQTWSDLLLDVNLWDS